MSSTSLYFLSRDLTKNFFNLTSTVWTILIRVLRARPRLFDPALQLLAIDNRSLTQDGTCDFAHFSQKHVLSH